MATNYTNPIANSYRILQIKNILNEIRENSGNSWQKKVICGNPCNPWQSLRLCMTAIKKNLITESLSHSYALYKQIQTP